MRYHTSILLDELPLEQLHRLDGSFNSDPMFGHAPSTLRLQEVFWEKRMGTHRNDVEVKNSAGEPLTVSLMHEDGVYLVRAVFEDGYNKPIPIYDTSHPDWPQTGETSPVYRTEDWSLFAGATMSPINEEAVA